MENLLKFQEELATKYKYKKLKPDISSEVRDKYLRNIPEYLSLTGDNVQLFSLQGTLISTGYVRIVIGDYGAFIEFDKSQACKNNYRVKKGQEYRINDPGYNQKVKYIWLTAKDSSNIKIYYQKREVSYADYKPEMLYVSPYEVTISSI